MYDASVCSMLIDFTRALVAANDPENLATADGACSADEATKINACVSGKPLNETRVTDPKYMCTYVQSVYTCFLPYSCACSDPFQKSMMDKTKTQFSALLTGCDLTCKSNEGVLLQVSSWSFVLTVFVLMFVRF